MVKFFVTGKWQEEPNWSSLTKTGLGDFLPMDPKLESTLEGESILSSLLKIDEKGIFVRSGKGSIDICLFNKEGIQHLKHYDNGVPPFRESIYDEIVLNQLKEVTKFASDLSLKTIVVTGSFFYHIRGLNYLEFTALEDKGDISQFFGKPSTIAVRNFHEGNPEIMFKSTFCRQIDGKFNGLDLGTGKCSAGATGIGCKVFINDMETTKKNLAGLLLTLEASGVEFL
jgi:hypothetical protein